MTDRNPFRYIERHEPRPVRYFRHGEMTREADPPDWDAIARRRASEDGPTDPNDDHDRCDSGDFDD